MTAARRQRRPRRLAALTLAGALLATVGAANASADLAPFDFPGSPVRVAGDNSTAQLGDFGAASAAFVSPGTVLDRAIAVSTNGTTMGAVLSDGTLYLWGDNSAGLIPGGAAVVATPTAFPGVSGVRSLAIGADAAYAVTTAGALYAWGENDQGQLGLGDTSTRTTPTRVSVTWATRRIASSADTVIAMTTGGAAYGWGDNTTRAAAPSTSSAAVTRPTLLFSSGVEGISTGGGSSFVARSGSGYGWGSNVCHRLGTDPVGTVVTTPRLIDNNGRWVNDVLAGSTAAVAIMHGGGTRSWGCNTKGELGRPTDAATAVEGDAKPRPTNAPRMKEVSMAGQSVLARDRDKGFWVWGDNSKGQLGLGAGSPAVVPSFTRVTIEGFGVRMVYSGGDASIVVRSRTL